MPLGSLIKSLPSLSSESSSAPTKNENVVIAESLLMELDFQLRETEASMKQQENERKIAETGVDYMWLVTKETKKYSMPQMERLELEELCMKVKPEECGRVITEFRNSLLREPTLQEMPRLMRACVLQVIESRPKEDTMTEWMMKSLSRMRPTSSRIMPIGSCSNDGNGGHGDNDRVIELQAHSPVVSQEPLFLSVDNLPV